MTGSQTAGAGPYTLYLAVQEAAPAFKTSATVPFTGSQW